VTDDDGATALVYINGYIKNSITSDVSFGGEGIDIKVGDKITAVGFGSIDVDELGEVDVLHRLRVRDRSEIDFAAESDEGDDGKEPDDGGAGANPPAGGNGGAVVDPPAGGNGAGSNVSEAGGQQTGGSQTSGAASDQDNKVTGSTSGQSTGAGQTGSAVVSRPSGNASTGNNASGRSETTVAGNAASAGNTAVRGASSGTSGRTLGNAGTNAAANKTSSDEEDGTLSDDTLTASADNDVTGVAKDTEEITSIDDEDTPLGAIEETENRSFTSSLLFRFILGLLALLLILFFIILFAKRNKDEENK
jgi:hypothetical protein